MYKIILQTSEVIREADGVVVAPCQSVNDPAYVEYLEWVEAGNEPVVGEYIAPRDVPQEVTPRQIRLALNALGLRQVIEAAVAAGSQDLKDTWEFSTVVERSNPFIGAMAGSLGMSIEQVDDLFILAASL